MACCDSNTAMKKKTPDKLTIFIYYDARDNSFSIDIFSRNFYFLLNFYH